MTQMLKSRTVEPVSQRSAPTAPTIDARDFLKLDTQALAEAYRTADPYPHFVVDGAFPRNVLDAVLDEIAASQVGAEKDLYGSFRKHRTSDINKMGPATRRLIEELVSAPFLTFLEQVTGIDALVPDPYLEGGGVHQIGAGGFLKVHTDFNWHKQLKMHRRLNLLLYLNDGWQDDWNGHLELWNKDVSECRARIAPIFNRMVVFSTTDESYHGHPDPLSCPDHVTRNSVALYYYTSEPSGAAKYEKSALTNYRERPAEHFEGGKLKHLFHQVQIRSPMLRRLLGKIKD